MRPGLRILGGKAGERNLAKGIGVAKPAIKPVVTPPPLLPSHQKIKNDNQPTFGEQLWPGFHKQLAQIPFGTVRVGLLGEWDPTEPLSLVACMKYEASFKGYARLPWVLTVTPPKEPHKLRWQVGSGALIHGWFMLSDNGLQLLYAELFSNNIGLGALDTLTLAMPVYAT